MLSRATLASLLGLAACGPSTSSSGVGNAAGPGAAPGPAPTIAWTSGGDYGGQFEITGLPAISADGAQVVYARQREDGARGMPNLTLVVADAGDAVVKELPVLAIADDDAVDTGAPTPAAVAAANQYLADTNASAAWTPLAAAPVVTGDPDTPPAYADAATATAAGVTVTFAQTGHLAIHAGDATVLDRDMTAWLVPDAPMYAGSPDVCSNPPYLREAWISAAHHLALLRVAYVGNDSCWEPDSELHVVRW